MSFVPHNYIKRAAMAGGPWPSIKALCEAYEFPTNLMGGGVIGIVECGGGWQASDTAAACHANGVLVPIVTDVHMDLNNSFGHSDADDEVALDIQVAAVAYAVATGKTPQIRMYWTQDIAGGVTRAAADGCDVCSISWGADEAQWGHPAVKAMQAAAAAAVAKGMVVFAAAGDNDSSDGGGSPANVDCPASCPSVIGCGGTNKTTTTESVWNNNPGNADGSGTGGGYSTVFTPMPLWQAGAPHGPGRMVPDVAANADPDTGYPIWVRGQKGIVGGTSAVAPLYAGLFAAFGRKLAVGLVEKLYLNQLSFHDIIQGNNGMFRSRPGPDACTGIGSPNAAKLATLLKAAVKP